MVRWSTRAAVALAAVATIIFTFGASAAVPDTGLQNVGLTCNDGTNLALTLDAAGLTQLSDAVTAIALNPAGDPALACGLSQPTTAGPSSNSAGGNDIAVGGGQIDISAFGVCTGGPGPAPINFSLSAHVPTGTTVTPGTAQPHAGGTFNLSSPESTSLACGDPEKAQVVAKVDCLQVSPGSPPGTANFTAQVTKASGAQGFTVGDEVSVSVADTGTNIGDTLIDRPTDVPCHFNSSPGFPITHGNITVRSGA